MSCTSLFFVPNYLALLQEHTGGTHNIRSKGFVGGTLWNFFSSVGILGRRRRWLQCRGTESEIQSIYSRPVARTCFHNHTGCHYLYSYNDVNGDRRHLSGDYMSSDLNNVFTLSPGDLSRWKPQSFTSFPEGTLYSFFWF